MAFPHVYPELDYTPSCPLPQVIPESQILHAINAALWLANAVVWAFYAGVVFMAGASLVAAGLSVYLWRTEP